MKVISLLILLIVTTSHGQAPSSDLAELKIKMVYFNRDSFLKPCTVMPSPCGLSGSEISLVTDLISKSSNFSGIEVGSASESPSIFVKDNKGQFPLYSSEGTLGSRILMNRDRLLESPFSLGAVFEIYVESMLSYFFFQQSKKVEPGNLIAKKIGLFWGKLFKSIGLKEFKEDKIELLVFKNNEVRILLLDSFQAHVLNPELLKKLKCDDGFLASVLTNYSTISWTKYQASNIAAKAGLRAVVGYQCVNSKAEKQNWSADLTSELEFQGIENKKWNSANFLVKVNGAKKEARR